MKRDDTKLGFYIVLGAAALAASFSAGKKSQQAPQEIVAESPQAVAMQPTQPTLTIRAAGATDPGHEEYRTRPALRERPRDRDNRL